MTAVVQVFRAQLRLCWRSWLAMALMIALIGGLSLGLVAAGRRTASAFPRLLSATASADGLVYSASAFAVPPQAVTHLPQVAQSGLEAFPQSELVFAGRVLSSDWQLEAPASASFGETIERGRLLQGRWANPRSPGQAVVSYDPPDGVGLGSVVRLNFYTPRQAGELFDAFGPIPVPKGPSKLVRVVGVVAYSADFPSGSQPSPTLYVTPSLLHLVARSSAVAYADAVRLHGGDGAISAFESAVAHLHGGTDLYVEALGGTYTNIERSIHLQAVSWWILAAIAAAAGLIVIAQVLSRRAAVESGEYPVLRVLGISRRQLFALGFISTGAITVCGVLGSIAVAFALSPLTPIGTAAIAEPDPGLSFDAAALLVGALAVFLLVLLAGAVPAFLEARRRRDIDLDTSWSGPPRPSVVAVLAVVALVGASVFGSSLDHLLASPRLYGGTYDLQVDNPGGTISAILPGLLRYSDISQLSSGVEDAVEIRGTEIDTIAETSEKGPLLTPPVISGHAVDGRFQIVLGESSLGQVGAKIGDDVPVSVGHRTMIFKVVGTAAFPVFGDSGGLGTGADMTLASFDRLTGCQRGDTSTTCIVDSAVLKLRPGPERASSLAKLEAAYGDGANLPVVPTALVNFGQSSDLPLVLGVGVALFGAAILHFLLVSVARRRRDTGVLKTLGLLGHQVRDVVLFQASAIVVVAIIVGVPLGVVVGRFAWDLTASGFGVVSDVVVPAWSLLTVALGSLVVGNLLALIPGGVSSHFRPATALRSQ